jgi:hypothetical protein
VTENVSGGGPIVFFVWLAIWREMRNGREMELWKKTEDGRVTDIVLSAPAEESDRERGRDRE